VRVSDHRLDLELRAHVIHLHADDREEERRRGTKVFVEPRADLGELRCDLRIGDARPTHVRRLNPASGTPERLVTEKKLRQLARFSTDAQLREASYHLSGFAGHQVRTRHDASHDDIAEWHTLRFMR